MPLLKCSHLFKCKETDRWYFRRVCGQKLRKPLVIIGPSVRLEVSPPRVFPLRMSHNGRYLVVSCADVCSTATSGL